MDKVALIVNADNYFYPEAVDHFLAKTKHKISTLYALPSFTDPAKHRLYVSTCLQVVGYKFLLQYLPISMERATVSVLPMPQRWKRQSSLRNTALFHGLSYKEFKSVNGDDFIADLKRKRITIALSMCSQIYKEKVLGISHLRIFNLHPSLLPRNKGRFPFFWAFYNEDKKQGVTCHQITERIDDGPIVFQRYLEVGPHDDVLSMIGQFRKMAPEYLEEALERIKQNRFERLNKGLAPFYGPSPTSEQIKRYKEIIETRKAKAGRPSWQSDASPSQPNSYHELRRET